MSVTIDVPKIQKAARNSLPLIIKTNKINHEIEEQLEQILAVFLEEFGQKEILTQISYCLRELAVNANKANTKRAYFMEKELDIDDEEDYQAGMASFKADTLNNIDYYFEKQKEAGLYIKTGYHAANDELTITIRNNSKISRSEQMRVYDRIARSRAFNSLEEAMVSVLDSSEGAGLGLVILVLMLKKLGLNEEAFDLDIEGEETVSKLVIPFSKIHKDNINELSREIVKEIDSLPQFPENIVQLQKMIDDPESEITDISKHIAMDMSLTADLLKIVNSAQYMLAKKVDSITDAVKLVGLRGLKNLLYSYGTQKILKSGLKEMWNHANKTAFYAYTLAKNYIKKKDLLDDVYIGGILHDIGRIIFFSAHPKLAGKISELAKSRDMGQNIFEALSAGLNHAEIGALIAEKWNFPEDLIISIRYHHEPNAAPADKWEAVATIYLANCMANFEEKECSFEQISKSVLKRFGITTEEQFSLLLNKLIENYDRNYDKEIIDVEKKN
ncbi:MAG: HDOD domain-containing protein [Spirochaetaceae bacterium]|nr:HDOD domain-containing protein [Spirochaetaceae bacterium]